MSYAETTEFSDLSEEKAELELASRTVYFHGGPVAPWQLFVGDSNNPAVPVTAGRVTTEGSESLVLRSVDRRLQEDARAVAWSGEGSARVFLRAEEPVDISRESNGNMVLAFDVLVETAPAGVVQLGMGCGDDCAAEVDLTATLAGLAIGEWQPLLVPLRCFADDGADMTRIDMPFSISTDGTLALRFSDVRLATVAEEGILCP